MTVHVSRSDGLIIPDKIPGDDLHPNLLGDVAQTLRTAGRNAVTHADAASTTWSGMPAVLESPQGAVIYGALGSPDSELRTLSGKFGRVAKALDHFASAVRPLMTTFAAIKRDAIKLTDEIGQDGLVWVSPQETKAYEWDSQATVMASRAGVRTAAEVVTYLHSRGESAHVRGSGVVMLASWTESSEYIDRNNALMDRVADAYAKLQNAEADCANAINRERDVCVANVEKIEAWQLKQSGDDTAVLPWGHRVDEDRNCGESLWWGVGNAGKEMLEGVAAFAGYNAVTGQFSLETAMNARIGLLEAVGALALIVVFPPSIQLGQLGVPVFKQATDLTGGMLKGLVAWDTWSKNPSEAFGRVLVNVGTFFIPGAGEVGGVIKGITMGAHVAEGTADAARVVEVVEAGASRVDGLVAKVDGLAGDVAGTGVKVDEYVTVGSKVELPDGSVLHVEAPHIDAPTTPHTGHGGDAPSTHSGGDAPSTHSGGDAPTTHSGGDAPTTHSGGDTPSTHGGNDAPSGDSGGDTPSGHSSGDDAPAGHSGGDDAPADPASHGADDPSGPPSATDGSSAGGVAQTLPSTELSVREFMQPDEIFKIANEGYGAAVFGPNLLEHYVATPAHLGSVGSGTSFFLMPAEDALRITDAASAARQTGMSPSAMSAYVHGEDVYAILFRTDDLPLAQPHLADSQGWPHFLDEPDPVGPWGHTAVRGDDFYLRNPTRELVTPSGSVVPPGSVLVRIDSEGWQVLRRFQ